MLILRLAKAIFWLLGLYCMSACAAFSDSHESEMLGSLEESQIESKFTQIDRGGESEIADFKSGGPLRVFPVKKLGMKDLLVDLGLRRARQRGTMIRWEEGEQSVHKINHQKNLNA